MCCDVVTDLAAAQNTFFPAKSVLFLAVRASFLDKSHFLSVEFTATFQNVRKISAET